MRFSLWGKGCCGISSIPTTAAAEVAVLHASKTSEDQSVLLWELQGPNSPTDIILKAYTWHTHTHTLYTRASMRRTQMHSTSKGNITISSDLHPPWLKSVSLCGALLLLFLFFFLCHQPSIPLVWPNPGFTLIKERAGAGETTQKSQYKIHLRLQYYKFTAGSRASGEKDAQNRWVSQLLLFHLWVSDLRVSCKLHLVIKSIASQRHCFPSHFVLSKAIFLPLLFSLPKCGSHGSEATVRVTLEWSSRKAPTVRSTRSLAAFMENLIEESWKDLSASRRDSACCSPSGKAHA